MDNKQKVEYLWERFDEYKETAEQHEFVKLFALDMKVTPYYNDLKENYTEEHAEIFIRVMIKVLNSLGINDIPFKGKEKEEANHG